MHKKFIKYFVDPKTNETLELIIEERMRDKIISGLLKSLSNEYPIVRGIPRFVDFKKNNYIDSFGFQWGKWPRTQFESENIGKPMA